ncbi:glutathione S-transferase [Rhizobium sp. RU20A]|uniref:glutathione S-transferase family protein n=1 Tax=Rhizobium sp. RU20A TaxID=1907412 RepID=UPI0009565600|nr:glutathione S-transferase family protein [Rhizobium sp. RU20A]SIR17693.1 glutathione S-transferase [Rhizobium sp. RU20A]
MTTLYGVYASRASRAYWMALELDIVFESVPVIQARRLPAGEAPEAAETPLNTRSPAYLAINPMGQIPALLDGDLLMTESLAIPLYLARKHGGPLAPADLIEEAQVMNWTLFAATAVEPHSVQIVMVYDRGEADSEAGKAIIETAEAGLGPAIGVIDRHLVDHPYLVGERFTVADLNLAEVLRYAQRRTALMDGAPALKDWLSRCQSRPAFQEMMARRKAELG